MKKILLLIALSGVIMGAISCSDDDEPKRGDGVFTVNTTMINHIVNLNNDEILGMSITHNKLTIDTTNHKASLELNYNDGQGDKTLKLSDIVASPRRLGFYELTSHSNSSFSGYVDFNESSMRYRYNTDGGMRVISTIPEVFFLKTANTITYDDTTKTTTMENVMYQFEIAPASNSAIVKVMDILHAKDGRYFMNITGNSVPVTVTRNGYTIAGENIKTTATYRAHRDSIDTNPSAYKTTDKYPFQTFRAEVDLVNDAIVADYMIGASATVTATGKTYPDYTAY